MPMRFLFVDNDIEYEMEYVNIDSLEGWLEYRQSLVRFIYILCTIAQAFLMGITNQLQVLQQ